MYADKQSLEQNLVMLYDQIVIVADIKDADKRLSHCNKLSAWIAIVEARLALYESLDDNKLTG